MYNCIYSGHCTQPMCDKSCPTLAETTYLLERNNLPMSSEVFRKDKEEIEKYYNIVSAAEGKLKSVIVKKSTVAVADMITYCGICQKWKGSRLHCTVYNLKFSQYLEALKESWSSSGSEELEYMKIWASSAKLLVISNLDYVNFRDFECQTLLTLLQSRSSSDLTTIVVTPQLSSLVGHSPFFSRLTQILEEASKA